MPTIGEALSAVEEQLFVGRQEELAAFAGWLAAPEPEILNVTGRGGVGKSALLRAFARTAHGMERPVVLIDGRDFPHTPEGLLAAVAGTDAADPVARLNETQPLILLDSADELGALHRYLDKELLPRLESDLRLVLAGRLPVTFGPDSPWRRMVRPMPLRGLSAQESQDYLLRRGIKDGALVQDVLGAASGNPLALTLAADMALHLGVRRFASTAEWHLAVRGLVEQLLREVHDPDLREMLEVCAVVRRFDESLLAALSDEDDVGPAFDRLCRLSAVRPTRHGLTLHDDLRHVLAEDLRWRRPDRYRELRLRALAYYRQRAATAEPEEREWLVAERLYLCENSFLQAILFREAEAGQMWVEPARPADFPEIRDVCEHTTAASEQEFGFERRAERDQEHLEAVLHYPGSRLRVARDGEGGLVGFSSAAPICQESLPIMLAYPAVASLIHALWSPPQLAALPATARDTDIWFLMHMAWRGEAPGNAMAGLLRDWYRVFAEGGLYLTAAPHPTAKALADALGFERVPEARNYAWGETHPMEGYVLDLRLMGVDRWLEGLISAQTAPKPPLIEDVEGELRALLAHWDKGARLAASPLVHLPAVPLEAARERPAEALRHAITRTLERLRAGAKPRDELAYRALELAYLDRRITHELAAERLAVSRATFYRLLKRALRDLARALNRPPRRARIADSAAVRDRP